MREGVIGRISGGRQPRERPDDGSISEIPVRSMMSMFAARWLCAFCVVVALSASVTISRNAYSQTHDCALEATSISGLRVGSTTPGVSPGSTSGTGEPGVSNSSGGDNRARIWAQVYADCVKRQNLSRPQIDPSEPTPSSPRR